MRDKTGAQADRAMISQVARGHGWTVMGESGRGASYERGLMFVQVQFSDAGRISGGRTAHGTGGMRSLPSTGKREYVLRVLRAAGKYPA